MKGKSLLLITFSLLLVLGLGGGALSLWAQEPPPPGGVTTQGAVTTAFTYQGRLVKDGNPVDDTCDFKFSLYDAASGGTQVGTTQTASPVSVSNGLFTVQLNGGDEFGALAFTGEARWLEIALRCPVGSGSYTTLSPRQALTVAPYALYTTTAPWSGLMGIPAGFGDGVDNDTTYSAGNGLSLVGTTFSVDFAGTGSANAVAHSDHDHDGTYWSLTGNAGTAPGTNFLGTTDNQALELWVNNARALRLEPNATSPNLIGGYSGNWLTAGVVGATIGGGGESGSTNRVTDDYGTVAGGRGNQAGDNVGTTSDRSFATVGGGWANTASGSWATVGGGVNNTAYASYATVGGGYSNYATDYAATVGGGHWNGASGYAATVPGGYGAKASLHGQMAYASGFFSVPYSGDAQASLYVMRNTSTGSGWTNLYLDGSSALLTIASGRTLAFDILIVGRSDAAGGNESAGYQIRGVIENVGGILTVTWGPATVILEDNGNWDVQCSIDPGNYALLVQVMGNGETIRWVATVRTAEVAW